MKKLILFVCCLVFLTSCKKEPPRRQVVRFDDQPKSTPIQIAEGPVAYVGTVKFDTISIRLLVLKHCFESIADTDAKEAIEAVNLAEAKGLSIRNIGNHYITKDGPTERKRRQVSFESIKEFVSEQMKKDALPGDTFIIYTIGHGSGGGSLQHIGQRKILADAFAAAAAENQQETLWWQLSCHAAAKLPAISDYTEEEQEYFSMLASSPANKLSYFRTQGAQMEKVFGAIAEKSRYIDPDEDETIVAKEFASYLNKHISKGRGDLLYARSDEEVIFGYNLANAIPIRDRNNPQNEYPRGYIPSPRR
jgi:hypothetical protein